MILEERAEALASLSELLDEAAAGHGGTAIVTGPVAVGKSTLLEAVTGRVADRGGLALTAIASESERDVPLGVFAQLLLGVPGTGEQLDRIRALITQGAVTLDVADGAAGVRLGPSHVGVVEALWAALLELSEHRLLAVIVDDVHHADAASAACLGYLARRIRTTAAAAVFGCSDDPEYRGGDFRTELVRRPSCRHIELRPLRAGGVAAMAGARLGEDEGVLVAADLLAHSGGNPLLIAGLLEDHRAALRSRTAGVGTGGEFSGNGSAIRVADPADLSDLTEMIEAIEAIETIEAIDRPGPTDPRLVPADGYRRAVLALLDRSRPVDTVVARALAVLGRPEGLERLLDLDAGSIEQSLAALTAAGLLDAGGFRRPEAAAAVLVAAPPQVRTRLHRRAAESAYAEGHPPTAVAGHLLAARGLRAPWAVPVLEAAADTALSAGRVTDAVAFLRLACDLCQDDGERARIKLTLVRAQWRTNPSAPALHLGDLLDAFHAGHLRGGHALTLAKALLWHGRFDAAREVLSGLSGPAGFPAPDSETRAELEAARTLMRCSYAPLLEFLPDGAADGDGDGPGRNPLTTEQGRRLDAATTLHDVLTGRPSTTVVEQAERILRGTRLEGMSLDTAESALLALTYAEQPWRAAPWCDALIAEARERQAPSRQARLSAIRAEISVRQGDLPGAEEHARTCLEIIPERDWGVAVGAALASLLTAQTAMGRFAGAAETLNLPVPPEMLQSRFGLHYLQARGRFRLSSGDYEQALADFRSCGDLMGRWGLDVPGLIAWRNDSAEALLRLGERERAVELLEEQLGRCGRGVWPRTRGAALRLLAATRDPRQRPQLLRHAADVLNGCGDRYELARTLTDLTLAYRALGDSRRARVIQQQAWTIAEECGAVPLSRLVAPDPEQPDEEPAAETVRLSDAEQRIASRVALGHTNREISAQLFITVSTVESHLTRIYRKLGVAGRVELAALLSASAQADWQVAGRD